MIDPANVPAVTEDKTVDRCVLPSSHFREDRTLKQDAFIPHP
jgi:hypothetical protein